MGIVSDILDAVRRTGRATARSALKRQDAQLKGKTVLHRSRGVVRNEAGAAEIFTATTAPIAETVLELSEQELAGIEENAARFGPVLLGHYGQPRGNWELSHLDEAFRLWLTGGDRSIYSDEAAIELFGALFGCYCGTHADMRWIRVTDQDGTTLALEGRHGRYRVFPYQVVSKRIHDSEFGFFAPIFVTVKSFQHDARYGDAPK